MQSIIDTKYAHASILRPANRLFGGPYLSILLSVAVAIILLATPTHAQNVAAEPVVGNVLGTATASSTSYLDAGQFAGLDMCASIANACSSVNIPNGTTIDGRAFTGNQVCKANNVTTMLHNCVTNGGKLLLGTVNIYADGPISPAYYEGWHLSGIGTPAFLIPSMFWGIEGVSRGASVPNGATSGQGTWLSICLGQNNPVSVIAGVGLVQASQMPKGNRSPGCTTGFPQREVMISSISVAGNTMTISLPDPWTQGTNVYLAELAMVKGGPTLDNGTFKIQTITNSTGTGTHGKITVTVPNPTACSTGCGNLILGTAILGFANTNKTYNDPLCFTGLCSGFGEHIKNLGFNCQSYDGCIGWQNLYAQEESGADTFVVNFYNFVGFDVHGGPKNGSQNFGPILNAEVYTGAGNSACAEGTTGAYIGDAQMRGFNGWTINNSSESSGNTPACGQTPIAALLFDAPNTEVRNGHCEGFLNCVLMGANNGNGSGGQVSGIGGGPSGNAGTNIVQISANYASSNGKYVIERIRKNFHTNAVMDNIDNVTLSDPFMALYSYAGIRAGAIATGVSANTDLAGQCTIGVAPSCANIPFTQTYSSKPICTCSDTGATAAACNVQVTLGPPTTLTVVGTNAHTFDYICIGRN